MSRLADPTDYRGKLKAAILFHALSRTVLFWQNNLEEVVYMHHHSLLYFQNWSGFIS